MKHGRPLFTKQIARVTDKDGKDVGMLYISRQTARARCRVSIAEMMQGKKGYDFHRRWNRLKAGMEKAAGGAS